MLKINKCIAAIFALLALVQCAKDRDLKDYQNEQRNKDFAKLQSVEGAYRGLLLSKVDGATLGALQITLRADTQVLDSNNETKANAQPVLVANIEFKGATHLAIGAQNGFYNDGQYKAEIVIPRSTAGSNGSGGNQTAKILLNGFIGADGSFTGSMWASETTDYQDFGGTFSLQRNGEELASLAKAHTPKADALFSQMGFAGSTLFHEAGVTKAVSLVLSKPRSTSQEDFLTLLMPVKPVLATLDFGGARLSFPNAHWNQSTGALNGAASFESIGQIRLTCAFADIRSGIECQLANEKSAGAVATISARPASGPIVEPPGSSEGRDPVERVYIGQGEFPPFLGKGKEIKTVRLQVIWDARSRLDEILELLVPLTQKSLRVTLLWPNDAPSTTFATSKWDSVSGTLDATQTIATSGLNGVLLLSCRGFHFTTTSAKYDFTCRYTSTVSNVDLSFQFKSR